MSYEQYKQIIAMKIGDCSPDGLNKFCRDVVLRILPFVDQADRNNLWQREVELIDCLADMVRHNRMDWKKAAQMLDELTRIAEEDDEHAIEMNGDLIQFLSAMDSWQELTASGDTDAATAVSESFMNILDFYFVGNTTLEDWLSVPQLRDELETQVKLLDNMA